MGDGVTVDSIENVSVGVSVGLGGAGKSEDVGVLVGVVVEQGFILRTV